VQNSGNCHHGDNQAVSEGVSMCSKWCYFSLLPVWCCIHAVCIGSAQWAATR